MKITPIKKVAVNKKEGFKMIFRKKYLQELIRKGKAGYTGGTEEESIIDHDNKQYIAVDRYDVQRVDHYEYDAN
jgi:hypothetical protein